MNECQRIHRLETQDGTSCDETRPRWKVGPVFAYYVKLVWPHLAQIVSKGGDADWATFQIAFRIFIKQCGALSQYLNSMSVWDTFMLATSRYCMKPGSYHLSTRNTATFRNNRIGNADLALGYRVNKCIK